jgi:hypothetical protein
MTCSACGGSYPSKQKQRHMLNKQKKNVTKTTNVVKKTTNVVKKTTTSVVKRMPIVSKKNTMVVKPVQTWKLKKKTKKNSVFALGGLRR